MQNAELDECFLAEYLVIFSKSSSSFQVGNNAMDEVLIQRQASNCGSSKFQGKHSANAGSRAAVGRTGGVAVTNRWTSSELSESRTFFNNQARSTQQERNSRYLSRGMDDGWQTGAHVGRLKNWQRGWGKGKRGARRWRVRQGGMDRQRQRRLPQLYGERERLKKL